MRRTDSAAVAREGVTRTQLAVQEDLGWLFREQPTEDYGIDAQIEVVEEGEVLGRLLAVQIKSGESWFDEPASGGWWYRPDQDHVRYWLSHSLPVLVVLYDPRSETCYWELITRSTLKRAAAGGWKVMVPSSQILDKRSTVPLREASEGDPYGLRIRELRLARPWMERLAAGERLVVDIEEWMNKSSGRGEITFGVDREDGRPPERLATWGVLLGFSDYAEAVPKLFAWADVTIHEETYDEAEHNLFETECAIWDEGDVFHSEDFSEWRQGRFPPGLHPYADDGEVASWRLELHLGDLGRAFLLVDAFASGSELPQLTE
jgi:hypothetical protein